MEIWLYAGTSEYLTGLCFVKTNVKLCECGQSAGKLVKNIAYQPLNDYTPNMLKIFSIVI